MDWAGRNQISSKKYRCGFCDNKVASDTGYFVNGLPAKIYICPFCGGPSYFLNQDVQVPGVAPGEKVEHVPDDLHELYDEARRAASVNSHTAAVLACRKLLMNIAVTQGAEEGLHFIQYVEYLADNGFVPPNGKGWVDHIRKKGNEATHEIALMKTEDAEELISFAEMLLKFIYEFPARVPAEVSVPD